MPVLTATSKMEAENDKKRLIQQGYKHPRVEKMRNESVWLIRSGSQSGQTRQTFTNTQDSLKQAKQRVEVKRREPIYKEVQYVAKEEPVYKTVTREKTYSGGLVPAKPQYETVQEQVGTKPVYATRHELNGTRTVTTSEPKYTKGQRAAMGARQGSRFVASTIDKAVRMPGLSKKPRGSYGSRFAHNAVVIHRGNGHKVPKIGRVSAPRIAQAPNVNQRSVAMTPNGGIAPQNANIGEY